MKSLFFASFLFLLAEFSVAEELTNYTITSDSQKNTLKGGLEAIGNVVVKRTKDNFEASSDKLTYDNDSKTLKLFGNVFIKNLEAEGLSIEETSGDELTIFTDTGIFEFKSQNKNRVKTKKSLKKGSRTNIAHNPNTTDGIAASNSTNEPTISLTNFGAKSSVINIAVPTPKGIVINNERREVTNVPYIAVKAPYSSFTGFHSEVTRKFNPYLEKDSND